MFYKLINKIKIAQLYKKNNIKIKLNKTDLIILKILIKLNLIKSLKYLTNNTYILSINNKNNFKNIKNLYKPSQKLSISYNELKTITFKKRWILILSTNKGILTNFEAIKLRTSGILILKLFN